MEKSSSNVFQGSDFAQSEDMVIIVENSNLFQDYDIAPNRLLKFVELMKVFIAERLKIDYRDRYFLVVFNAIIHAPMVDFESFSQVLISQIQTGVEKTKSVGEESVQAWATNFIKVLQNSIQKCIASFKKIRNKTLRILMILNRLPATPDTFKTQVQQIIERTAQRLNIVIDILFIAGNKPVRIFDYENPLKMACEMTGGSYFPIKNVFEFDEAFKKITEKKKVLRKSYLGERIYSQEKQFLELIASELEKISEVLDESELKCNICFKFQCACNTVDAYEHLRKCPNCKKVLHSCCSGKWAESQNTKSNFIGFPNVFRCPYCFFLLKVPRNFVNFDAVLHSLQERWLKENEIEKRERKAEEQKEREIQEFIGEVEEKQSEEEKIIKWLTAKLPDKSQLDIKRVCDDIMMLNDREEKISFINYLKFKENIEDDSLPI